MLSISRSVLVLLSITALACPGTTERPSGGGGGGGNDPGAPEITIELPLADGTYYEDVRVAVRAVVIDDEDANRVRALVPVSGHGDNPAGATRGERDDAGDIQRGPNLSRGRYSWWTDPGDVEVYEAVRPRRSRVYVMPRRRSRNLDGPREAQDVRLRV